MVNEGYSNADARKGGCGCVVIGGIAIGIAWFILFVLSVGDCLSADNVACHVQAVKETKVIFSILAIFLVGGFTIIFVRYLRR